MNRIAAIGFGMLFLGASAAFSAEPAKIPANALEAMAFFIGDWEGDIFEGGQKIAEDVDQRRWAPGRHCVLMDARQSTKGGPVYATGISGWDVKAESLIEYWHDSQGTAIVVRYPLTRMKPDLWEGTSSYTTADGKSSDGPCQLAKTPEGYVFTAGIPRDGKEVAWKGVARRATGKNLPGGAATQASSQPSSIPAKAFEAMAFFVGNWEAESSENGEKVGTNVDRRTWAPGGHCLAVDWSGSMKGVVFRAAAVSGYDAKANALVEHWYGSEGDTLRVSYPLSKMNQAVWEGEACYTATDGKSDEGLCRLTKTPQGYEYTHQWTRDGKEFVHKAVTRRVKAGQQQPSGQAGISPALRAKLDYFLGSWTGEAESSDGAKGKCTFARNAILDGKFHQSTLELPAAQGKTATLRITSGWAPGTECLRDWYFGSDGGTAVDTWKAEKEGDLFTLRGEREGLDGEGRKVTGSLYLRVDSKDQFFIQLDVKAEGQPASWIKAVWHRVRNQ